MPISQDLYDESPRTEGSYSPRAEKAFERAVKRAGIELPGGQCTHVPSYIRQPFYDEWRNILVLRDILGHADIKMMIYSHFSPEHLGRCSN